MPTQEDLMHTADHAPAPHGRRRRAAAALLLAAAGAAAAVAPGAASADRPSGDERARHTDLQAAKAASARFHDVRTALAEGFQATDVCEESPAGAMGFHYVNFANFGSTDLTRPAVLLYQPDGKGGVRLAGVEWVVPDADQDLGTAPDRPHMFGGTAFDGPMPGHVPGMPVHYDLHVWLWEKNPSGTFAPWNPAFSC